MTQSRLTHRVIGEPSMREVVTTGLNIMKSAFWLSKWHRKSGADDYKRKKSLTYQGTEAKDAPPTQTRVL